MYVTPGTCMCLVMGDIISAFGKHLLSMYSVSGPGLGVGDTERKVFDNRGR